MEGANVCNDKKTNRKNVIKDFIKRSCPILQSNVGH